MNEPNELTATEAAARIRRGDLTAEALVQACLQRIEAREPEVQAWTWIDPDYALAQAREADARLAEGQGVGPLHGVPVGVKDIIDTADMPTENGSPMFRGRRPERDAACVTALREAGAIILGKTVTTELANTHPGKTRNPHNPAHTPGGSSSGSAAGVADFHMPLALGTQTGGSVIRPASYCGIYGVKPTVGLIPRRGVLLQSHTLDTLGAYGRSLEDLGLALDCLSLHEPDDGLSFPRSRGSAREILAEDPPSPPRFAFLETPAWSHADPGAQRAIRGVVERLGDRCREEGLPSPFDRIIDLHLTVMGTEDLAYYGTYLERTPELLSDALRQRLIDAKSIPAADYVTALNEREVIYADLAALLDDYDAVLCLASASSAPRSLETTGSPIFNGLWTYLGVPCVTLPRLEVDGLPMGLQLVGKRRDEGRLLRTARVLDGWLAGEARG
jgi:Asp-tRNA(Asn)/Glu-tRNA(Gln) amidotransferase A subunit family amidase